jgi:flavin-binding protein dodecin
VAESVYRVTEVIGTSTESWEAAARNAVETAAQSIRDLRIAEATRFDVTIQDGKVAEYRVRLGISFKYEAGD